MDVAELVARRALLVAVQAPGEAVPEFSVGQSTAEGPSIYRTATGQWAVGHTERGIFERGEVYGSEDAACQALWQRIITALASDGFALRPLTVGDGSLGLRVRTSRDAADLARYAQSGDLAVRANLAMRTDLPAAVLDTLARDRSRTVTWRVAANPSTPALERFVPDLAAPLALNPALPEPLIEELLESSDPAVRWRIARNPLLSSQQLAELAHDTDFGVRWGVASNTSTPLALLETLANDEEFAVRLAVELRRAVPGERPYAAVQRAAAH